MARLRQGWGAAGLLLVLGGALVFGGTTGCGCTTCDEVEPGPVGGVPAYVPDFALPDVNPLSATAGTDVGPRNFVGRISVWYFGYAT